MKKPKFNKGDEVYFKPSDMFGIILEVDNDDMYDTVYYYVSLPCGNLWFEEKDITGGINNG